MGAPMKNTDPDKTFRVGPDEVIAREDARYEVRVSKGLEPEKPDPFKGMTLDEIEATID